MKLKYSPQAPILDYDAKYNDAEMMSNFEDFVYVIEEDIIYQISTKTKYTARAFKRTYSYLFTETDLTINKLFKKLNKVHKLTRASIRPRFMRELNTLYLNIDFELDLEFDIEDLWEEISSYISEQYEISAVTKQDIIDNTSLKKENSYYVLENLIARGLLTAYVDADKSEYKQYYFEGHLNYTDAIEYYKSLEEDEKTITK